MLLTGEIKKEGAHYVALLEPLHAYAQGRSRAAAHKALAAVILEHAAETGPLEGWTVDVADDGEDTLYVTSSDPARLIALLLRRQRDGAGMSLAAVAKATGSKSRNGWAQYEHGRSEPSIDKLQGMLDAVTQDYVIAIIPRGARVLPRWEETRRAELAEVDSLIDDPSPENVKAIGLKRKARAGAKAC